MKTIAVAEESKIRLAKKTLCFNLGTMLNISNKNIYIRKVGAL